MLPNARNQPKSNVENCHICPRGPRVHQQWHWPGSWNTNTSYKSWILDVDRRFKAVSTAMSFLLQAPHGKGNTWMVMKRQEKREEIWLNHMTKAPSHTEKLKKQRDKRKRKRSDSVLWQKQKKLKRQRENIKNANNNFDNTTIADRLRTVSWSYTQHTKECIC